MSSLADSACLPIVGVGAVIWNRKGEVVLIRRGTAPRRGEWSIPGGKVEAGESLRQALAREVKEETGLTVEIGGLIDVVDAISRDQKGGVVRHYVLVDFTAHVVEGELQAGSDASDARFVPLTRLDDYALWSETRRIILASAEQRRLG